MADDNIIECLFDPNVYELLIELEDGAKDDLYLSKRLKLSKTKIKVRFKQLIKFKLVSTLLRNKKIEYKLDKKKLSELITNKSFDGVTDNLTTLNSFLN